MDNANIDIDNIIDRVRAAYEKEVELQNTIPDFFKLIFLTLMFSC